MHFLSTGMIVTLALIIWKELMCVSGSESPVVVLSGSKEPGFKRVSALIKYLLFNFDVTHISRSLCNFSESSNQAGKRSFLPDANNS